MLPYIIMQIHILPYYINIPHSPCGGINSLNLINTVRFRGHLTKFIIIQNIFNFFIL